MKPVETTALTLKGSQKSVAFHLEPGSEEKGVVEIQDSLHTVLNMIVDDKQEEEQVAQIRARSRSNLLGMGIGGGGRMSCWRRRKKVIVGMIIGALGAVGLLLIYHPW